MNTRTFTSRALRNTVLAALWAVSVGGAWFLGSRHGGEEWMPENARHSAGASVEQGSGAGASGNAANPFAGAGGRAEASPLNGKSGTGAAKGGDFSKRLTGLQNLPPGPGRNKMLGDFFNDWAKADPRAALAGAAEVLEPKLRHDLREAVLTQWGAGDPAAAWAFAKANEGGELPDNRLEAVLNGIGQGDVRAALRFFETHGNDLGPQAEHAGYVFDELYEKGNHDTLVPWVENMPEGPMKAQGMNHIIDRWARYDPAGAKAWMERNMTNPEQLPAARAELAESWARVDPDAAMKWIGALPETERNPDIYARALGQWIEYDRNAAGAWLAAQPPGPAMDRPIERYTYEVMRQNPADTMPWAESIHDDRRRRRAIERVAEEWRQRDPKGLEAYVTKSGLPDADKQRILRVETQ